MTDTERERINAICEVAGVTEIDDMIERFDGSLAYSTNSKEICQYIADLLKELKERRELPEIVFCKDCAKHNKSYGDNGAIDSCPLVLYRGKAQGHEFDYQYCAFAERRTDEQG